MQEAYSQVNGNLAALSNVVKFMELTQMLLNREPELPPFGVFHGPAGVGKSTAAIYSMNKFRAYYVQCQSCWTQKDLLAAVMVELELLAPNAKLKMQISEAVNAIGRHLAQYPERPLVIDEADFMIQRRKIELVRDIAKVAEGTPATIILIGEENLPNALKAWERIDSRVLKKVRATPLTQDDVFQLCKLFAPDIEFTDGAVNKLQKVARGSARRIVTKLAGLREQAGIEGLTEIGDDWNPTEED
ncbi:MAG: AAA family ATPase [Magnetovibrionaceae bacterium]